MFRLLALYKKRHLILVPRKSERLRFPKWHILPMADLPNSISPNYTYFPAQILKRSLSFWWEIFRSRKLPRILFQLRIARRQLNFRKEAVYLILTIKLISSFVGFCGREVIDASVILATWKLKFVLIDLSDIIKLNHFAQFHRIRIV